MDKYLKMGDHRLAGETGGSARFLAMNQIAYFRRNGKVRPEGQGRYTEIEDEDFVVEIMVNVRVNDNPTDDEE